MNIIKRSGEEMEFERGKIAAAIRKANETVEDADKLQKAEQWTPGDAGRGRPRGRDCRLARGHFQE